MTTEQSIIAQRATGKAVRAIAEDLGMNERKVRRILDQHRDKLAFDRVKAQAVKLPRTPTGKERSPKAGTVARCKGCRGKVIMPCQLCAVRGAKGRD